MAENNVVKVIFEAVTGNLNKALDDTSNRLKNIGGLVKGFGVAMGAAAGAAAVKLGKDVVQQFGELEQNLGGSEAVFQDYADHMQKIGVEAYKNMGVTQSQYLATANKMGALFQGSGLDVQKSAVLTEKAMQRAADMASVMGIDMQFALDSVAGAAKGNFTMMDNLGVAMNAANIEAYALAKGLDFTWRTATQAEKADVAMQMFFENTEQYAGNFAKESTETISGSIGLLQAAFGSFMAGLGNANANMTRLTGNLIDSFQAAVKNIVPVIENILAALPQAMPAIIDGIKTILPPLLETLKSLFSQVLNMLISLLPELVPFAVDIIMTLVNAIIDNLPLIMEACAKLVAGIGIGIIKSLPGLSKYIPEVLAIVGGVFVAAIAGVPAMFFAPLAALAAFLIYQMKSAGSDMIRGLWEGISGAAGWLRGVITGFFSGLIALVKSIFGISSPSTVLMQIGVDLILGLINGLKSMVSSLLSTVTNIASSVLAGFKGIVSKTVQIGKDIVGGIWKGISGAAGWLKNKVSSFCGGVEANVKSFFRIASPSKVFASIGKFLAEGLGVGFVNEMAKVSKAMTDAVPKKFNMPTVSSNGKILPNVEKTENDEDIQSLMGRLGSDEFGHYNTEEEWRRSQIALADAMGDDKPKKGFTEDLLLMMKEKLVALTGLEPYLGGADERNILEAAKNKLLTEIVNLTNEMKGGLQKLTGAFNVPSQFMPLTEYAYGTVNNTSFTRSINTPTMNMYLTIKDLDTKSADEVIYKANHFANTVLGKDDIIALGMRDILRNY